MIKWYNKNRKAGKTMDESLEVMQRLVDEAKLLEERGWHKEARQNMQKADRIKKRSERYVNEKLMMRT